MEIGGGAFSRPPPCPPFLLQEIKDVTKDRGESMSDTSPLVKIRLALQAVKVGLRNSIAHMLT